MNVAALPYCRAVLWTIYLYFIKLSAVFCQCVKTEIDFPLAGCCNFMVMTFNSKPASFNRRHISLRISCWVSTGALEHIRLLPTLKPRLPPSSCGWNSNVASSESTEVRNVFLCIFITNIVKDEKFGFRCEICCRTNTASFADILPLFEQYRVDHDHNASPSGVIISHMIINVG